MNGAGSVGGSDIIYALAMNGTNQLFVGGKFTSVDGGSIPANNIASWDGNSWNILGTTSTNNGVMASIYPAVHALAMNGTNNLFVGGQFTSVDGYSISANNIASWDGNSWNILGKSSANNGVNGMVSALAMNGTNNLFVGGQFTKVNGSLITANYIASWNGNSWNILGTNSSNNGVNGIVYALAMNGTNQLFVGGLFSSVDGGSISTSYIASWNGSSWDSFTGISSGSSVNALAMNGTNNLFVGGQFTSVDGDLISANNIASWNGSSWSILGINSTNNGVDNSLFALAMNGTNNLFVGGQFTSVDGITISQKTLLSWDGNSWSVTEGTSYSPGSSVRALTMNGTDDVFLGGEFSTTLNNNYYVCSTNLVQMSTTSSQTVFDSSPIWSTFEFNLKQNIEPFLQPSAIVMNGTNNLFANAYSWNGNSWNALGTNSTNSGVNNNGVNSFVYALAMNGTNQLFVGGQFTTVGGSSIPANNIASWNGSSWNILGTTSSNNGVTSGIVYALAMNGTNQLFVGGLFISVDGYSITANNIASWDGNSWNILGTNSSNNGVNGTVYALAMNGTNNLFVGGKFTTVGGSISANNIASWDGNSWNYLGSNSTNNGVGVGLNGAIHALAMNGTNNLFVGGYFAGVDGSISVNNIASWDGNSWNILGSNSSNNGVGEKNPNGEPLF